MNRLFFFWALFGLIMESVINLTAAFAGIDLTENVSASWLLHLSLFVVFWKAILQIKKKGKPGYWPPKWLITITIIAFMYAIVNFILFAVNSQGDPCIINDNYALTYQGKIKRFITEKEYHLEMAIRIRGITGHLMAFFSLSAAILYPYNGILMGSKYQESYPHENPTQIDPA